MLFNFTTFLKPFVKSRSIEKYIINSEIEQKFGIPNKSKITKTIKQQALKYELELNKGFIIPDYISMLINIVKTSPIQSWTIADYISIYPKYIRKNKITKTSDINLKYFITKWIPENINIKKKTVLKQTSVSKTKVLDHLNLFKDIFYKHAGYDYKTNQKDYLKIQSFIQRFDNINLEDHFTQCFGLEPIRHKRLIPTLDLFVSDWSYNQVKQTKQQKITYINAI